MKRLLLVVAMALIGAPFVGMAQDAAEIPASTFGDGWSVEVSVQDDPAPGSWQKRLAYFGPDGNRVLVLVFGLGDGITDRAAAWQSVTDAFVTYSGATADMVAVSDDAPPTPLAGTVSDALRFACLDAYGRVCATSAYAATEHAIALIVRVDGTVNGMSDLAATDFVAGLYFAALSV